MSTGSVPPELGPLFPDGTGGYRLDVKLPPGYLVRPGRGGPRPAYWLSDGPVEPDLFQQLLAEHPRSGLWPVFADGLDHEPDRPWLAGEVDPEPPAAIDRYAADTVMRSVWTEWVEPQAGEDEPGDSDFDDLEPFGRHCPGLATPGEPMAPPEEVAAWYADLLEPAPATRLLLAKVPRGADLPAVVGWHGPANHSDETAPLAAMLRSWEDRFGARLLRIGFDTVELSVAAPPATPEHALHVAAEHWAFCPDNVIQGPGTLREYADEIRAKNSWSFWWD